MPSIKPIAAVLALGASTVLGHAIMIEPAPFNLDSQPLLQTWPLGADLPFPCQGRTQHTEEVTKVTAGKTQLVKFWGSAVHGGGSCQFGIAYGEQPPKAKNDWHTIYSIIGGCPADAVGNIETERKDPHGREDGKHCGNDGGKECVREFAIPIPAKMKNGPATFAWTWFNKIGNREMYMNCAPIIVEGGVDDDSFVDTLPSLFVANVPGECTTGPSGVVIGFPEPGEFGKVYQSPSEGSQGTCPAAQRPEFEGGDGGSSAPPAASSAASSVASSVIASVVSSTVSYVVSSSTASAPPISVPSSSPISQPSKGAPSAPTTSQAAPVSSAPVSDCRPEWAVGMVPCSPPGALICLENHQFGICNHGWAVPQPLAAGQKCENGQVTLA